MSESNSSQSIEIPTLADHRLHTSNSQAELATKRYIDKPIPHYPRLERLLLSQDWTSSYHRIHQNPYQKLNQQTEKVKRPDRKISVKQLIRNLYNMAFLIIV